MHTIITLENLDDSIKNSDCPKGWHHLLRIIFLALFDSGWDGKLLQVKEKFGELRIYIDSGTDTMYDILDEAERKSLEICEVCGEAGELRTDRSWFKTLCEKHNKEEK